MNANDIIEKCAEIADDYAAPNRFSVADCWKDGQSPSEVYDTAAIDVGGWIAQEIRALKSSLPAETVNEEVLRRARDAFDAAYAAEYIGGVLGCRDNKDIALHAALEAAFALARADDGWRPIESGVPKDGTTILVSFGTRGVHAVGWCEPSGFDHEIWCVDDGKHGPYALRGWNEKPSPTAPTHWRPLPAPPKDGRE